LKNKIPHHLFSFSNAIRERPGDHVEFSAIVLWDPEPTLDGDKCGFVALDFWASAENSVEEEEGPSVGVICSIPVTSLLGSRHPSSSDHPQGRDMVVVRGLRENSKDGTPVVMATEVNVMVPAYRRKFREGARDYPPPEEMLRLDGLAADYQGAEADYRRAGATLTRTKAADERRRKRKEQRAQKR